MIVPANRAPAPVAAGAAAGADPAPPGADPTAPAGSPTGANGGDGDSIASLGSLDARIAALVARATTADDEALERQREAFDLMTRVRAESDREINVLREMAMEEMKQDDELLKKWIALI